MANKEIHDLITAEQLSSSDVIAEQREDNGTWLTRKLTFNALGLFLNKVLAYASDLQTTNKTIIGAINEVKASSGVILTDTLEAGSSSIVFTDNAIIASSLISVYADVWYSSIVTDGVNHTCTITFPAQSSAMDVSIEIK